MSIVAWTLAFGLDCCYG